MEPNQKESGSRSHPDSETARFWGEPAEDRADEFEDK